MAVPPLETLEKLKLKETLIRLRVPGRAFERLVIVSAIHTNQDIPQVVMDCPEGLTDILATMEDLRLDFEFTGEDQMGYRFSASDAHLQANTSQYHCRLPWNEYSGATISGSPPHLGLSSI